MLAVLRSRILSPLVQLLSQGVGPRELAMSVAIGLVVGVFPVLGTTTVLCTMAALVLRLNLVAIHTIHYAATPLQLVLIIPFVRAGEHLVGTAPQPLSVTEGLALIDRGIVDAVIVLRDAIVHAVIGWLVLAPLLLAAVYWMSRALLTRWRPVSDVERRSL